MVMFFFLWFVDFVIELFWLEINYVVDIFGNESSID